MPLVDLGTAPTGADGDTNREAFDKINDRFDSSAIIASVTPGDEPNVIDLGTVHGIARIFANDEPVGVGEFGSYYSKIGMTLNAKWNGTIWVRDDETMGASMQTMEFNYLQDSVNRAAEWNWDIITASGATLRPLYSQIKFEGADAGKGGIAFSVPVDFSGQAQDENSPQYSAYLRNSLADNLVVGQTTTLNAALINGLLSIAQPAGDNEGIDFSSQNNGTQPTPLKKRPWFRLGGGFSDYLFVNAGTSAGYVYLCGDQGAGVQITGTLEMATGAIKPATIADASAPVNSIYYSSTASKLVYKDSGGTVNNLY